MWKKVLAEYWYEGNGCDFRRTHLEVTNKYTSVLCYYPVEPREQGKINVCYDKSRSSRRLLVIAFAWFWLAKALRIIGRFRLSAKDLTFYRLPLTDMLPMDKGKAYRPYNCSSLNAP